MPRSTASDQIRRCQPFTNTWTAGRNKPCGHGKFDTFMKHRANRSLIDCSATTHLVIQEPKAFWKEAVDGDVAKKAAARLTEGEVNQFYKET